MATLGASGGGGAESASPGFFQFTSAIQMLPLALTLLNTILSLAIGRARRK